MVSISNETPPAHFRLPKFVLRFFGISLYDNESKIYQLYSGLCIVIITTYTMVEGYGLVAFKDDIDYLTNVISLLASHVLGLVKVFVMLKNKFLFAKILEKLEGGVLASNSQRDISFEEKIITRCITMTTKQAAIYWAAVIGVIFFGMLGSLLTKIKSSNYRDWDMPLVPFSLLEVKSTTVFILIYCYQSLSIIIFAFIISSLDLLITSVIAHIKTQFTILNNIVKNIEINKQKEAVEKKNEKRQRLSSYSLEQRIIYVVKYHQSLLDLASEFENCFNFLILTVFIANTLVLCFTMYHSSLYSMFNPKALGDFCYVITICVQVLFYCYWGNEVALESESVAVACYKLDFFNMPVRLQKELVFIIQRSQKSVIFTAGKFVNLSLGLYVSLLRLSYSYYMILRRINDVEYNM